MWVVILFELFSALKTALCGFSKKTIVKILVVLERTEQRIEKMDITTIGKKFNEELIYDIGSGRMADTVLPYVFIKACTGLPISRYGRLRMRKLMKDLEAETGQVGLFETTPLRELDIVVYNKLVTVVDELIKPEEIFEYDDFLGSLYEFFILNQKNVNGEHYTPQSVSMLVSDILKHENPDAKSLYDPTCGSGRLLVNGLKAFS